VMQGQWRIETGWR